jgi:hypothetical protein
MAVHDIPLHSAAASELARAVRQMVEEAALTRDVDGLEDVKTLIDEVLTEIQDMWRDMPEVLNAGKVDIPSGGSS